jgi:hypothetical protein
VRIQRSGCNPFTLVPNRKASAASKVFSAVAVECSQSAAEFQHKWNDLVVSVLAHKMPHGLNRGAFYFMRGHFAGPQQELQARLEEFVDDSPRSSATTAILSLHPPGTLAANLASAMAMIFSRILPVSTTSPCRH